MHPKFLSIEDFDYVLPAEKIAEYPLKERDLSKLLIYERGSIQEDQFVHLASYLPPNSYLLFNDTRVLNARILFPKHTGAVIEIFLLHPTSETSYETAFQQTGLVTWHCFIGKAGKWKEPVLTKEIQIAGKTVQLKAQLLRKDTDSYVCALSWEPQNHTFSEVIEAAGVTPLPPYIKRKAEESDKERYQSIFSREEGSVAAPTASLHFTEDVFQSLEKKGIEHDFLTLHVGAGTFKPVKSTTMQGHEMHAEFMDIRLPFLERLHDNLDKEIYCIGTTSVRTAESIYHMGVKALQNPNVGPEKLMIQQWEVYEQINHGISARAAVEALIAYCAKRDDRLLIPTQLMIAPGYKFQITSGIITNFHQPKSTLLLLVAAFAGSNWHKVYEHALARDFRFLSYGDACLFKP